MPVNQLGTVIASRTSWGKNQIKQQLGYEVKRANYNRLDLYRVAWKHESELIGFGQVNNFIGIVDTHFSEGGPTMGYRAYICSLRTIWEANELELEFNSASGEFLFSKRLLNKMKQQCVEGTSIGKNQILSALYFNALNLLDYV